MIELTYTRNNKRIDRIVTEKFLLRILKKLRINTFAFMFRLHVYKSPYGTSWLNANGNHDLNIFENDERILSYILEKCMDYSEAQIIKYWTFDNKQDYIKITRRGN